MIGGRFKATKVETSNIPLVSRMTGLFHNRVASTPVESTKVIHASAPVAAAPSEPLSDVKASG